MKLALTGRMEKYVNHICGTCEHMRIKIGTEEHLDPIILVCELTNEETTECSSCPNWEIEK